jgi:hypothetical protein
MPNYHAARSPEVADLQDLPSVAALRAYLGRRRSPRETFEAFERELGSRMRRVECELKAAELARYDVDAEVIGVGGQEYRRCLDQEPKTYTTSSGPVTVPRNLFRAARGGKAICPLELRAGIIGACTPLLARQVCFLMGQVTSTETAAVFTEMGIEGPSASTCDRVPKLLNPVWEQHREQWEAALRAQEEVPAEATVLAASLDGVLVPDREAQREAKAAREAAAQQGLSLQASGPAGYREVGCGTVSLYAPPADPTSKDPDERSPQRLDTVRYARAPEYKKKTLTAQLDAEVDAILAARPDLHLVALADGAEENWRYFEGAKWAAATKIVDHGHASQHLKAALAASYGDTVDGRAQYERLRLILRDKDGGADEVLAELDRLHRKLTRHPRRRKLLKKERKYFRNQRGRMDYARYQRLGLPIGSGVVEAACKTLAAQRLKRSGMNWGDGKQPLLTIRSLQQSNRWERGWQLLAAQFRKPVSRVVEYGPLRYIEPIREAA